MKNTRHKGSLLPKEPERRILQLIYMLGSLGMRYQHVKCGVFATTPYRVITSGKSYLPPPVIKRGLMLISGNM